MTRAREQAPPAELPAVDERLVMPNTRYEIIDGRVHYVAAADEPHGRSHSRLCALLEAYAARGYNVAADMLTRTSAIDDMAPDASIYPAERDPETGGRQLEELAFEIASTQRLADAAHKAGKLAGRGVRRIFALDVKRSRVLEYAAHTDSWQILARDAVIEDRALATPLPARELCGAAHADDAMARALLAKDNPVLAGALAEGRAEGHAQGRAEGHAQGRAEGRAEALAEAVVVVLESRGLAVPADEAERIRATRDERTLARWLREAATCGSAAELV